MELKVFYPSIPEVFIFTRIRSMELKEDGVMGYGEMVKVMGIRSMELKANIYPGAGAVLASRESVQWN